MQNDTISTKINPMWGGLIGKNNSLLEEINQSISFDCVLYKHDIQGSIAHACMLAKQNIISHDEYMLMHDALKEIEEEIDHNNITFDKKLEDIHMNIEHLLRQKIGDVAGKLHTARSRNDQVATDIRLWLREQTLLTIEYCYDLREQIVLKAQHYTHTAMPGFTHYKQPNL